MDHAIKSYHHNRLHSAFICVFLKTTIICYNFVFLFQEYTIETVHMTRMQMQETAVGITINSIVASKVKPHIPIHLKSEGIQSSSIKYW